MSRFLQARRSRSESGQSSESGDLQLRRDVLARRRRPRARAQHGSPGGWCSRLILDAVPRRLSRVDLRRSVRARRHQPRDVPYSRNHCRMRAEQTTHEGVTVEERLRQIIATIVETTPDFAADADLKEDLDLDSHRAVELVFEVEST